MMSWVIRILRLWKTPILQNLAKMYPLNIPHQGVVQTQWIQAGHNQTWCADSLKSSEVLYDDSHVLYVFLHNTSLHVALAFYINFDYWQSLNCTYFLNKINLTVFKFQRILILYRKIKYITKTSCYRRCLEIFIKTLNSNLIFIITNAN